MGDGYDEQARQCCDDCTHPGYEARVACAGCVAAALRAAADAARAEQKRRDAGVLCGDCRSGDVPEFLESDPPGWRHYVGTANAWAFCPAARLYQTDAVERGAGRPEGA